ncbi:MAG: hypothetical protein QOH61_2156 [Chloroflexota bacterium]|nr:hypothetical protein [Chloroflexota bacterium]
MASLVRFALFTTILLVLVVFVLVPLVAGPLLGSIARNAGLQGDDMTVSVDLLGPALLAGRAESVHVDATNVDVPHGVVGHLELTLEDVSVADHSFSALSGTLSDVRISGPGGIPITVKTVELDGPASRTRAHGTITGADARQLVKAIAAGAGVPVDGVQLHDGSLTLESRGLRTDAALRVAGRALVLDRSGAPSIVLVAPEPSEDWELQDVTVTATGIQVQLNVDAAALAKALEGSGTASQ